MRKIKNEKGYISIKRPGTLKEKICLAWEKVRVYDFRDWKKISILFILAIATIFLVWALASKTAGEVASLSLSPISATVTAGSNFTVAVKVDTKNNNVVAVKSVINYSASELELVSWDTSASAFSSGNACIYQSKPCEIVANNPTNGSLAITLAKPAPGINTSNGQIANLTFKAKKALSPTADNITLQYIAFNNYTDSDVIFNDGSGTDILSQVTNTKITADLPVPTSLAGLGASATGTSLSWASLGSGVGITGYNIFRNNVQIGTSATTTYSDTGLSPLTSYSYKVSAYDASGHESTQTVAVSVSTLADTTKPSVPSGLVASLITMNGLHIAWNASTDDVAVAGYNIYRNNIKIGTSTATSYDNSGLSPDTTYTYKVSAYDVAGNDSGQSASISPKTLADTQAPSVPGNLSGQAVSVTQVNLSWTASTDNVAVTGYNIYRNGSKVGTSTGVSYNDTGLSPSTTYSYQISAYDAKNNVSDKTPSFSVTTNSDTQAPSVPGNLSGTSVSMTQINLSWSASTDNVGVAGYRVFRNGTQVATPATTTYQDTGLTKATAYSYTVLAYDAAGNASAQTTPVSVTTLSDTQAPSVPGNLSGTSVSMTQINLSWSASTDNVGVAGYRLYRNGNRISEQTGLNFNDIGLLAGTKYSYQVSAYDVAGNESAKSTTIQITTPVRKYTIADFTNLVADWLKTKSSPADVSGDGKVNSKDLGIMMGSWQ
jgi:chitodextrinase